MFKSSQEPDIPAAIGPLNSFSTDELKDLLNNDDKFEEIIKDNQQVLISIFLLVQSYFKKLNDIFNLKDESSAIDCCILFQLLELESEKEEIMVRNRSLAEFNLSKEPELEESKNLIQSLSEEGNQLCASVQAKLEQISKLR